MRQTHVAVAPLHPTGTGGIAIRVGDKCKAVNLERIPKETGIAYVVEGSVRKAGNRVRINAQLIEGATGGHVWAARYDRDLTDIFAVQDGITHTIVDQLAAAIQRLTCPAEQSSAPSV